MSAEQARRRSARFTFAAFRHLVLGAGSIVMLFPFVLMVSTSLKPPGEIFAPGFALLPTQWHAIENYTEALTRVPLWRFVLNGIGVGIAIFTFQALIALPAAYALAKLRFPGRGLLFAMVLFSLLVPLQVTAIPLYILFWKLGILDTYGAIILPHIISVFGIFLLRQSFRQIPDELIHAARLDGVSELGIAWRIAMPMVLPALSAFGILSLVWNWNEFFWPLIVVQSEHITTPPLGIMFFKNAEAGTNYGPLMAGAVIITAPLVLAFLLAQRRFLDGFGMTGIK